MPWRPEDAARHSRKANSPERQRIWAEVANRSLARDGDEARAIRIANFVIARLFARAKTQL